MTKLPPHIPAASGREGILKYAGGLATTLGPTSRDLLGALADLPEVRRGVSGPSQSLCSATPGWVPWPSACSPSCLELLAPAP